MPLPQQGAKVRRLTLNETFETAATSGNPYYGRLIQMLGTTVVKGADQWGIPIFYQGYQEGRGDVVKKGATEIWEIYNLTGDTHPIHFHLVNVQVLNRQAFDDVGYSAAGAAAAPGTDVDPTPFLIGSPTSARPQRRGLEGDGAHEPPHGDPGHHALRPAQTALACAPQHQVGQPDDAGRAPTTRASTAMSMSGTATSWSTKSTT